MVPEEGGLVSPILSHLTFYCPETDFRISSKRKSFGHLVEGLLFEYSLKRSFLGDRLLMSLGLRMEGISIDLFIISIWKIFQ